MNPILLTHANLDEQVVMTPHTFFMAYYSKAHKSTLVIGSGGAVVPVKETKEQVWQLVSQELELLKGVTNDRTE